MYAEIGNTKLDFNLLSPFYFIVDKNLTIISNGKSFEKLFPDSCFNKLENYLKLARPWSIDFTYDDIKNQLKKVFVFQNSERDLVLRGQVVLLEEDELILFLGSPWMKTTDELIKHKLSLTDFALNDPTPDAVQLLKMNEINMMELREMTDRLEQQKHDIEQKEMLYRGLVENASEMIYQADVDGKLLYVNPATLTITGYSSEEIISKEFFDLITLDMREEVTLKFEEQKKNGTHKETYEYSINNKEGAEVWIYQTLISITNKQNVIIGYSSVGVDISLRKEMEQTLETARQKALESARIKERFIANTSHELRTPMNAIIGLSNLLTKTPLLPKQSEFINAIKTSSENLLVVINDVLDMSKIESEKLEIEFIEFNLKDKIAQFMTALEIKASEKNILLLHEWKPEVHEYILGDPYRLNQVLTNLVSNAIKFTTDGEVKLTVELDRIDEENNVQYLNIKVKDTGEGISEEKHKSIFEGFSQADASITRKFGGTGLGLTISKSLVELMGGVITLESEVGKGSTFSVLIPFKKCEDIDIVKEPLRLDEDIDWSEYKVLLVEDNQFNQLLAENILGQWKVDVEIADNGKIAIEKIQKSNFDVILMDIQMPEMDGIEATQYIRGKLQIATPIIALTANAMKDDLDYYESIGMDACITKPFKQDDLQDVLYRLFSKEEIVIEHEVKTTSWHGKKILLVEDNEYNQLLVVNILRDWGLEVDTANNGYDGLEKLNEEEYDMILMDILMPKMGGVEATRLIRNTLKRDTPIVAFSAHLTSKLEKEFLEVGMNGCIPKPFKVGQLKKTINDVFNFNNKKTRKKELHRPSEGWKGKKILVVEDNPFNQLLVVNILEGWDMEIETAENGEDAINKIKENNFDLILMDIQMPIMDGVEATKFIREDLNNDIPIIALTANTSKEEKELYEVVGMNAIVSKPFDLEVFEETIKEFLSTTTDNDSIIEEKKDINGISVLIVEDNPFNILLLRGILDQWDISIDEAENGKIAVELVKENKYDLIFMDIQMPVMDGVQATKIMREELQLKTPIIAITANTEDELVNQYFAVGMNACIPKPYGQEELQQSIMKLL
ncbi:response regulator [Flammeovirga pectinis]|uniref:Response regulator n=1 Tax=Flammeovirga pectinis TaxID=2494373 RepID=A0A3S9PAV4_9BACT|nr:response regulator [Flammeovirga pectinis]AZQ65269.1 response regulator [Flammeovirga pectinis]